MREYKVLIHLNLSFVYFIFYLYLYFFSPLIVSGDFEFKWTDAGKENEQNILQISILRPYFEYYLLE